MFLLILPQRIHYVVLQVGLHSGYVDHFDYGVVGVLFRRDQDLELYGYMVIWSISDALGSY